MSEEHDRLMRTVKRVADDAGDLRKKLQFTSAVDALRTRRTKLDDLEGRLSRLRHRGYLFKAALEGQLAEAAELGPSATEELLRESREAADRLDDRIDKLGNRARKLVNDRDLTDRKDQIDVLEGEKRDLEGEVRDAERRLSAISDPVVKAADAVDKGVREAEALLEAFDEATFSLQPGENPIAAIAASWEDGPGGAQGGKLFLTDARVRFEQDEVKKSGGFLGFGADKTHVKELRIDEPVGFLAASDDTTRGWVFKDQVLAFKWSTEAKTRGTTTFEVSGMTAKELDALVEAIRDGSIASDRVAGVEVEEQIFEFATTCSACSANLPAAVKGQRTLTCPYCSTVNNAI